MPKFQIIGQKFLPSEFRDYCKKHAQVPWAKKIILHNTASPRLDQRPGGVLTKTHILNLKSYYEGKGWSGGPHLFVDATGIWVFNPLDIKGVHSPSFNHDSWGVEMLGDYDDESFTTGLGAQVAENAVQAVAALCSLRGWNQLDKTTLLLHKQDPRTNHDCPGENVDKQDFIDRVNSTLNQTFTVVVDGKVLKGAFVDDGVSYAPIRELSEALGFKVVFDQVTNRVTISK